MINSSEFRPVEDWEKGLGTCFKDALGMAGITFDGGGIGEWLTIEDIKEVCRTVKINIATSEEGHIEVGDDERLILIYKTREGRAHAEFVDKGQVGKFLKTGNKKIIGVIKIPD